METIVVMVRRWFDGQNTYHTVRVVAANNAGPIIDQTVEITYGYGDAWVNTACDALGCDLDAFRKANAVIDLIDVKRKSDLHLEGKRKRTK